LFSSTAVPMFESHDVFISTSVKPTSFIKWRWLVVLLHDYSSVTLWYVALPEVYVFCYNQTPICYENCSLLGYYAASSGNLLQMFRETYRSLFKDGLLEVGRIGFSETSATNYHYSLRNNPEKSISHLLRGRNLK
jgi:hypothetical protein